jgi:hypothetical protein
MLDAAALCPKAPSALLGNVTGLIRQVVGRRGRAVR